MNRGVVAIAVLVVFLVLGTPAIASPVTFRFSASVMSIYDPSNYLHGSVSIGQSLSGIFTFSPSVPDSGASANMGVYLQQPPDAYIAATLGDYQIRSSGAFQIQVVHEPAIPEDDYRVNAHDSPPSKGVTLSNGTDRFEEVGFFLYAVDCSTVGLVHSTALPSNPPDFSHVAENMTGITLEATPPGQSGPAVWYVRATSLELSLVPEPSTFRIVWSGLGAVGLVAAWRRRKRAV
jgi:hypothetical protein